MAQFDPNFVRDSKRMVQATLITPRLTLLPTADVETPIDRASAV